MIIAVNHKLLCFESALVFGVCDSSYNGCLSCFSHVFDIDSISSRLTSIQEKFGFIIPGRKITKNTTMLKLTGYVRLKICSPGKMTV